MRTAVPPTGDVASAGMRGGAASPDDVRPLTLDAADDPARHGGKAANLARLFSAGLTPPRGFVLPAAALEHHLARIGLPPLDRMFDEALARDEAGGRALAATFRARLLESRLDATLRTTLDATMQAMLAERSPARPADATAQFAVRSSAIGEDGAKASFAGVFDTELGVPPDAIERAVLRVWAGALGDRALAYARHRRARPGGMAVIVQTQVEARWSGVLFTRDPLTRTPDDAMVVECCEGTGDALVSGAITPTRLRIDRRASSNTANEATMANDGTMANKADPPSDRALPGAHRATLDAQFLASGDVPVRLPQPTIDALARLGHALETIFGAPQDIEWSVDRADRLVPLQSRPITAPMPAAADATSLDHWTNANIAENFPGPVCPLLASFVAQGYAAYFRGLGRAFGIARRRIDAMQGPLEALVGTHAGRLYYNLTNIHAVLRLAPLGDRLAGWFNGFTGAEGRPHAPVPGHTAIGRTVEAVRIVVRVPLAYARVGARVARFEGTVDDYAARTTPDLLARATPVELSGRLRDFLDIRLHRWTDAALADTAAMVCYGVLQGLLARWRPAADQVAIQNDLLKGLPDLASARPVEALWDLSREARSDPRVRAILAGTPPDRPAELLAALDAAGPSAFRRSLDAYFARWGFRYSSELMLTEPTPQEDPLPVLRLLQSFAREDGPGPAATSALQAEARCAATASLARELTPLAALRALPLASRAGVFRVVLRATQGAIRLRERARMKQALLYTRLRHVALRAGDTLVDAGRLGQPDDVFFLTMSEAIDATVDVAAGGTGHPAPVDLRERVAARRARLASDRVLCPPDTFALPRGAQWQSVTPPDEVASATGAAAPSSEPLRGSAACGGRFRGRAAVVLDVTRADRVRAGDVLVTRQTDPGWAAVFFLVKGLVIERGGMLSHGAIIAREYGIPAVVGVRDATRSLRDGEEIEVDGDRGLVIRHGSGGAVRASEVAGTGAGMQAGIRPGEMGNAF